MTRVSRLLTSAVAGVGITLAGVGLGVLGGWGPCGPATLPAAIGGWMSVTPGLMLCEFLLGNDSSLGNSPLVLVIALAPACLIWSLLAFAARTCWSGPAPSPRPGPASAAETPLTPATTRDIHIEESP